MYRGRGEGRGRGGNLRGSMGGRGRGAQFSSWAPSAFDSRPATSTTLDWANSEARAKMLGRVEAPEGNEDYYDYYGRDTAPGPADYHSSYNQPEYVSYPVKGANQPMRPSYDSPKPRGGGAQHRGGGAQVGKRPPAPGVPQSPNSGADAKRVKLSSMNELLESSQRDMSALSTQGNSELSKVLEKQQKLLEMQSKLIAEMAGGANNNAANAATANGTTANGATNPPELMKQESKAVPTTTTARGAHQRGGGAQRGGESRKPVSSRGGQKSIWDTLGSGKPEFPTSGRGARGRGEAGFGGRGAGAFARGRGEGSLARGRGSLARGRGAAALGRGRDDVDYGGGYAESDPYATRGRGALRGARGRGGAPYERPGIGRKVSPYEADPYAEDPYADPYAADPYADPYAADPYGADPYAADPYVRDPYAADPYARDPYARDPYGEDPYARDPYEADPYARDPYGEDPYARDPYAADPYGEDPYARDPYAVADARPMGRGRGRGRGRGAGHEVQRRDPNLPLYDGQSVESRMQVFIGYIFQFRKLFLPISAIETTRHEHVNDVKVRTQYVTFEDETKSPSEFGMLRINGVIMAVKQSSGKNDLKDQTYRQALYHLLTMSVSEILAHSIKMRNNIPKKIQDEQHLKGTPSKVIGNRLQYMVDMMREELYDNQQQGLEIKLIHEIDVASGNAQAGVTLVYRRSPGNNKMITCELYADDLMLASASAYKKLTAYYYVYTNAKKYLLNFDKTSLDIVYENKRLQELDIMDENVIEVVYKGRYHERGSNLGLLKTKFPGTWRKDIEERRNLVVMMHSHDRASIPYKVLEDLANLNHMLIEFVNYSPDDGCTFRCVIFIQGELLGDGEGNSRNEAKDNAARKVLTVLSENNSVVQVGKRLYNKADYNFAAVKEAAQKMQTENPTMFKDWKSALHPQPAGDDPPLDELTPYVDKILEDLIHDYIGTQGLEEIILDRDFPACFITMMLQMCKDLDVDIEKKDGDANQDRTGRTVIQKSVFRKGYPTEIVKVLQENNNHSGRYTLTQWVDDDGQVIKKRF